MSPRLKALLLAFPLLLFLLWSGWPFAPFEKDPPGPASTECEVVQRGTSRGGAEVGGGPSCALRLRGGPTLARVARVVDGDTVVLQDGSRVRYIGVDTPEIGERSEFYGQEAKEANRRLVEGRTVRLEKDTSDKDRYGRLLRYVYTDGIQVNAELVREGYARAVAYPPDIKYQKCLEELEKEAAEARRGIWAR